MMQLSGCSRTSSPSHRRRVACTLRHLAPTAATAAPPLPAGGDPARAFEEWELGQTFVTARRTISDSDISTFVQLVGYQARHVLLRPFASPRHLPMYALHLTGRVPPQSENLFRDMEFLKSQGHPARMAPGILTASVADALIVGSGCIEGFAIAMIGMNELNAKAPVYAGDTLYVEFEVTKLAPSSSKVRVNTPKLSARCRHPLFEKITTLMSSCCRAAARPRSGNNASARAEPA